MSFPAKLIYMNGHLTAYGRSLQQDPDAGWKEEERLRKEREAQEEQEIQDLFESLYGSNKETKNNP